MPKKKMISVSRDDLYDLLTEVAWAVMFFRTQDECTGNMLRAEKLEGVAEPLRKASHFHESKD